MLVFNLLDGNEKYRALALYSNMEKVYSIYKQLFYVVRNF